MRGRGKTRKGGSVKCVSTLMAGVLLVKMSLHTNHIVDGSKSVRRRCYILRVQRGHEDEVLLLGTLTRTF